MYYSRLKQLRRTVLNNLIVFDLTDERHTMIQKYDRLSANHECITMLLE